VPSQLNIADDLHHQSDLVPVLTSHSMEEYQLCGTSVKLIEKMERNVVIMGPGGLLHLIA
jgi:hypothetical protein